MRSSADALTSRRVRAVMVLLAAAVLAAWVTRPAVAQDAEPTVTVDAPAQLLTGVPTEVEVTVDGEAPAGDVALEVGGQTYPLELTEGAATVEVTASGDPDVRLLVDGAPVPFVYGDADEPTEQAAASTIPGWTSLLPPFIAIAIALAFRQVLPALFLGVWIGAWGTYAFSVRGLWSSLLDVPNVWVIEALAPPDGDTGHMSIVVFTLLIGGMVGIIARNGGTTGIVERVTSWASDRRRGQIATSFLGMAIFFDDYANTLVVGNALRPVTDRLQISREKLAYIVDSTAAPVASIALISTWVGFEVGLIDEAIGGIGLAESGYSVFINSLPYRFYPLLALLLVFTIAFSHRDFGPMLAAERRAVDEGKLVRDDSTVDAEDVDKDMEPKSGVPNRLFNAVVPIFVLVGSTLAALLITGEGETLRDIVGSADAFGALVWGSLLGVLTAAVLSLVQRLLSLSEIVNAWFAGVKSVMFVLIILTMAWALSATTEALNTAGYLSSVLGDSLPPWSVPALLFVLAGVTSFATGTSWGTMGILMPLTIPLTWAILQANDMGGEAGLPILYAAVSTVLAGAVWGDHCSPISDTTVLSSLASQCDHVDHVRTQIPYALTAGVVGIVLGLLPVGFGVPWWVALPVASVATVGLLVVFGREVHEVVEQPLAVDSSTAEASA